VSPRVDLPMLFSLYGQLPGRNFYPLDPQLLTLITRAPLQHRTPQILVEKVTQATQVDILVTHSRQPRITGQKISTCGVCRQGHPQVLGGIVGTCRHQEIGLEELR